MGRIMKRRSFLKGVVVALVVPKILLSEKAKTGIPVPETLDFSKNQKTLTHHDADVVLPTDDNSSIWLVNWGEDSVQTIGNPLFYGDTTSDPELFSGISVRYK